MVEKVSWTPEATETFLSVINYLSEKWTFKEIEIFVQKTDTVISVITSHPLAYRKIHQNKNIHKAFIVKQVSFIIANIFACKLETISAIKLIGNSLTQWLSRQNEGLKI